MPETTPFDLLVAGEINPDLILSGDVTPAFGQVEQLVEDATLTIGSSSAIFACGAARLGIRTALIGLVGDDPFGRYMLEALNARDVDTRHAITVPGGATGLSVILNRGLQGGFDRAILTHVGLMSGLRRDQIADDLLRQSRHLHVASYFLQTALQPDLPALFRRARELGLTTSLDTNYDPSEQWAGFDELLAATDIFFPNEKEACSLAGTDDVEQAAMALSQKVPTLAVKLGPDGALGVRGGRMARVPPIPVRVVDTVGAGDSFNAGFIYGHLHGWDMERSLRLAVACGGISTESAGGTPGQPTLAQALARMPG